MPPMCIYGIFYTHLEMLRRVRYENQYRNRRFADGESHESLRTKDKKDAVELGLKTLVRLRKHSEIRDFRSKLSWEGDLDEMRTAS